jgi:hypothetical protein
MQPSDFLAPFGRGSGSPCPRPTSMRALVLYRPRMHPQTRGASETDHRLSAGPDSFEERRGPPRLLGRPLRACRGRTPRQIRSPPRPSHGEVVVAFRQNSTLGIRNGINFEAATPRPTRSRAYASPAPLPRPSPGSLPARAGSPLAGRVSHPLDDKRSFMKSSHLHSPSTSRAWSHYSSASPQVLVGLGSVG